MMKNDTDADLAAIRIASVNPILDPWIYILLRRSLFRRFLGSSRRGKCSMVTQSNIYMYPDVMRDSHVFTQLMCNANVITQLPSNVTFTPYDTESLCQT